MTLITKQRAGNVQFEGHLHPLDAVKTRFTSKRALGEKSS